MNASVGPIEIPLMQQLSRAVAADTLALPSLPEIAQQLQTLRGTTDIEPARLVALISRDMATAARLVQIANSAANRRGLVVESVNAAVARLGTELSFNIAMSFAMQQLFTARSPLVDQRLRHAWRRGQEVAALARVLAAQCTLLNPELAMLAGLMHGIGKLPVLRIADGDAAVSADPAALDRLVEALHPAAGCRVLRAWKFPEMIVDTPAQCLDLERSHDGPADYADVVTVALLQSAALEELQCDAPNIPAFEKLDMSPSVDVIEVVGAETLAASRELIGVN